MGLVLCCAFIRFGFALRKDGWWMGDYVFVFRTVSLRGSVEYSYLAVNAHSCTGCLMMSDGIVNRVCMPICSYYCSLPMCLTDLHVSLQELGITRSLEGWPPKSHPSLESLSPYQSAKSTTASSCDTPTSPTRIPSPSPSQLSSAHPIHQQNTQHQSPNSHNPNPQTA